MLSLSPVAEQAIALLAASKDPRDRAVADRIRAMSASPGPKAAPRPKGTAVGKGRHQRCVHHEPIALPHLETPVLCFDEKPTAAAIRERVRFATYINGLIAKRHAAWLARPKGDGKIDLGPGKGTRRLAPHAFPAWARTQKEHAALTCDPKPRKRQSVSYVSKFTGPRRKWRKGHPLPVAAGPTPVAQGIRNQIEANRRIGAPA